MFGADCDNVAALEWRGRVDPTVKKGLRYPDL